MSHRPPYSGGRPPPAYGMQQGWSFTGPPPGHAFPATAGHAQLYPQRPPAGPPYPHQPQMHAGGPVPAGPMFHHAHSQFPPYGAAPQHYMPHQPQMQPNAAGGPRPRPPAQKYLNKKEREKAKRERKEARKLAEQPMPVLTEDAQPRAYLNDTERQETLDWIAERKSRFPSKENLAKKQEAAAALAQSGGSEGNAGCDGRLFTVLQEQHKRGLLRTAGTEDLFRAVSRRQGRGPRGKGPPAAAPSTAAASATAQGAVQPAAASRQGDAAPGAAASPEQGGAAAAVIEGSAGDAPSGAAAGGASAPPAGPPRAAQGSGAKRGPPEGPHTGPAAKRQNNQGGGWARAGPGGPGTAQRKPCLLHRLVAGDVRQDRNLLLQVIRFFVTNNYLQGVDVESLQFPDGAGEQS